MGYSRLTATIGATMAKPPMLLMVATYPAKVRQERARVSARTPLAQTIEIQCKGQSGRILLAPKETTTQLLERNCFLHQILQQESRVGVIAQGRQTS